jgi:glutamate-1-semialdehyde aminotransferase
MLQQEIMIEKVRDVCERDGHLVIFDNLVRGEFHSERPGSLHSL